MPRVASWRVRAGSTVHSSTYETNAYIASCVHAAVTFTNRGNSERDISILYTIAFFSLTLQKI